MSITGYLAPPGFEHLVKKDLTGVFQQHGRLFLAHGEAQTCPWAQNIWYHVEKISIRSITDGSRQLKARQRNWWPYAPSLFRRAQLIQSQLPSIPIKEIIFPEVPKRLKLGAWTLESEDTLWLAQETSSPFPNGEIEFVQDHKNPPSRAYLKLYEALTILGKFPKPGERCLDLGASPGGWSWVLTHFGAKITAVDRAPLSSSLMQNPSIQYVRADAFSYKFEPVDWLFSDVICYPDKLYQYLEECIALNKSRHFVCTIKFQGDSHYDIVPKFAKISNSKILHLWHNKHELTWMLYRD